MIESRAKKFDLIFQDFFMMSSGKRKRDEYSSQLTSGGYMPQQDGSGDVIEFILPQVHDSIELRTNKIIACFIVFLPLLLH